MKDCIIYGAGKSGEMAFKELKHKDNVLFFVDSDARRWGEIYCGLQVRSPNVISDFKETMVVVAVKYLEDSLLENIKKFGVKNIKIYHSGLGMDFSSLEEMKREKAGVLIEALLYTKYEKPTGAERLLCNVVHALGEVSQNILPIEAVDDFIVIRGSCKEQCRAYKSGNEKNDLKKTNLVKGDKVAFLSTTVFGSFHNVIDKIKDYIESYVLIWDIYCTYQKHVAMEYYKQGQAENLKKALIDAKGLICYSKTVADEIVEYYKMEKINRKTPLGIYVFPLGYNLRGRGDNPVRNIIKKYVSVGKVFLMVGTIKPHKGYKYVLEAFRNEMVHKDAKLLVLGQKSALRTDWHLSDEMKISMGEMDNFLWISDASDDELSYCYEHATALIQASFYEGYGLPLVEAAQYGLPLICSDIPIFREVTCGYADYFEVGNSASLVETLLKWLSHDNHPDSRKIPVHTWRESAETLLDIVEDRVEPYVVLK